MTGLADRNWQAYLRQTEQRALEAERTREEAALRRAGEERLRIARELHDSLTHSISIVKLQAGVAVHLARKRGEEMPPALLAIQEASGEAMRELRATLEVLRTDEPTGTPALLVERARAAGLAVDLTVTGNERPLTATVDRAAYRIVQEALTNAARHAGPAKVAVATEYEERRVDDTRRGRRHRRTVPAVRRGHRAHRHARTCHGPRRHPARRPARGGRLLGTGQSAAGPAVSGLIRVALVDDQALMRAGFRALLDAEEGIEVVGEAADGEQGLALVREHVPDIALVDVQMPVMTGIEATRRIAADPALSGVRVVMLTNYGLDEYVFEALRAGASGFLLKDTEPADLLQAIEVVARGEALLSPSVTRTLIGEFVARPPDRASAPGPGVPHPPRTRGHRARRPRPHQRGDRRPHGHQPLHGQDPCQPRDDQARRAGPCPTGRVRLRVGAGRGARDGGVTDTGSVVGHRGAE